MAFAYESLEDGQVVVSDEPREDLEELARWESIPVADAKAILKQRDAAATPKAPAKTAAEKKAEKIAADAEAARIAALPIHVGDSVKLTAGTVAHGILEGGTADALEAWRGTVTAVSVNDDGDDVADFEGEAPSVPITALEIVEPEAK